MRIALRDIIKKGIEISERQNKCHDDIGNVSPTFTRFHIDNAITLGQLYKC